MKDFLGDTIKSIVKTRGKWLELFGVAYAKQKGLSLDNIELVESHNPTNNTYNWHFRKRTSQIEPKLDSGFGWKIDKKGEIRRDATK